MRAWQRRCKRRPTARGGSRRDLARELAADDLGPALEIGRLQIIAGVVGLIGEGENLADVVLVGAFEPRLDEVVGYLPGGHRPARAPRPLQPAPRGAPEPRPPPA